MEKLKRQSAPQSTQPQTLDATLAGLSTEQAEKTRKILEDLQKAGGLGAVLEVTGGPTGEPPKLPETLLKEQDIENLRKTKKELSELNKVYNDYIEALTR
jgi:hypothetical protein